MAPGSASLDWLLSIWAEFVALFILILFVYFFLFFIFLMWRSQIRPNRALVNQKKTELIHWSSNQLFIFHTVDCVNASIASAYHFEYCWLHFVFFAFELVLLWLYLIKFNLIRILSFFVFESSMRGFRWISQSSYLSMLTNCSFSLSNSRREKKNPIKSSTDCQINNKSASFNLLDDLQSPYNIKNLNFYQFHWIWLVWQ